MDNGFYLMHRGWLDHPILDDRKEPFSRHAAWAWLIDKARWQDGQVRVVGKTIWLERGQMSYALRYIATAWRWPEVKVRRFLKLLQDHDMIILNSDAGISLITVCNYDEYQLRTREGDAEMTQERRKTDANKKEPLRESSIPSGGQAAQEPATREPVGQPLLFSEPEPKVPVQGSLLPTAEVVKMDNNETRFADFFAAYPRKSDKKRAKIAYLKALKQASHDEIMDGLRRYEFSDEMKWIPLPATWLNNERWVIQPGIEQHQKPEQTAPQERKTQSAQSKKPTSVDEIIEAWCCGVQGAKLTQSANDRAIGKWSYKGEVIDRWAKDVIAETGFVPKKPQDLAPILDWLDKGLGSNEAASRMGKKAVEHVEKGGAPIYSLRFFDNVFDRTRAA